jgi:hypothetical protein
VGGRHPDHWACVVFVSRLFLINHGAFGLRECKSPIEMDGWVRGRLIYRCGLHSEAGGSHSEAGGSHSEAGGSHSGGHSVTVSLCTVVGSGATEHCL